MGVSTGLSFPGAGGEYGSPPDALYGFQVLQPYYAHDCSVRACADVYRFHGIRGLQLILQRAPGPTRPGQHELFLATARENFRFYLRSIRDQRMRIRTALRRELEWKGLLSHMGAAVLLLWGIPAIVWVAAKLWGAALAALAGS